MIVDLSDYEVSNLRWLLSWAWCHREEHPELNNGDLFGSVPQILVKASAGTKYQPNILNDNYTSFWDDECPAYCHYDPDHTGFCVTCGADL